MGRKVKETTKLRTFRLTEEVDAMLQQLAEDNFTSKTGILHQLVSKEFKQTYGNTTPRGIEEEGEDKE